MIPIDINNLPLSMEQLIHNRLLEIRDILQKQYDLSVSQLPINERPKNVGPSKGRTDSRSSPRG